jgi:hypothetical protein
LAVLLKVNLILEIFGMSAYSSRITSTGFTLATRKAWNPTVATAITNAAPATVAPRTLRIPISFARRPAEIPEQGEVQMTFLILQRFIFMYVF